ncbi:dihydroneopterin aldolase [secondary endosymbiont of Heteropsylla cubana]|uniref:7,8-dihydroneopterin aldolase n=1 Tax=secondary endosymbiont of Heteropsylla cubana TaxID=134287 RepID=J3Z5K3_9ENTR|nr:dihydroneopterin aldolase [secondary endosymbiont of Heteropsylla cubana]AFP85619.1 dihydroneopterin aldolase [secondary endosymbiont of Heteropsylla cubana]
MDIIFIKELTIMTYVGVYNWEKNRLQKLVLDLEISWNNQLAAISDNVVNCLNYEIITEVVISLVTGKHFSLIETVAENISDQLISQFKIPWILIKVSKPSAIPQASNVGVIIERGKR